MNNRRDASSHHWTNARKHERTHLGHLPVLGDLRQSRDAVGVVHPAALPLPQPPPHRTAAALQNRTAAIAVAAAAALNVPAAPAAAGLPATMRGGRGRGGGGAGGYLFELGRALLGRAKPRREGSLRARELIRRDGWVDGSRDRFRQEKEERRTHKKKKKCQSIREVYAKTHEKRGVRK